jgi:hypothetical protein
VTKTTTIISTTISTTTTTTTTYEATPSTTTPKKTLAPLPLREPALSYSALRDARHAPLQGFLDFVHEYEARHAGTLDQKAALACARGWLGSRAAADSGVRVVKEEANKEEEGEEEEEEEDVGVGEDDGEWDNATVSGIGLTWSSPLSPLPRDAAVAAAAAAMLGQPGSPMLRWSDPALAPAGRPGSEREPTVEPLSASRTLAARSSPLKFWDPANGIALTAGLAAVAGAPHPAPPSVGLLLGSPRRAAAQRLDASARKAWHESSSSGDNSIVFGNLCVRSSSSSGGGVGGGDDDSLPTAEPNVTIDVSAVLECRGCDYSIVVGDAKVHFSFVCGACTQQLQTPEQFSPRAI